MTIPVWVLLAFAGWTLLTLLGGVATYRWRRILTGRVGMAEWRADQPQGSERYQRAMRAHMNCVENLPVYAAIVVAILAAGVSGPVVNALALAFMAARIGQTLIHVGLALSESTVWTRFLFYLVQLVCMFALGVLAALRG